MRIDEISKKYADMAHSFVKGKSPSKFPFSSIFGRDKWRIVKDLREVYSEDGRTFKNILDFFEGTEHDLNLADGTTTYQYEIPAGPKKGELTSSTSKLGKRLNGLESFFETFLDLYKKLSDVSLDIIEKVYKIEANENSEYVEDQEYYIIKDIQSHYPELNQDLQKYKQLCSKFQKNHNKFSKIYKKPNYLINNAFTFSKLTFVLNRLENKFGPIEINNLALNVDLDSRAYKEVIPYEYEGHNKIFYHSKALFNKKKKEMRYTKTIRKLDISIEIVQEWKAYWNENSKEIINNPESIKNKQKVILSRHPIDVLRMSDFKNMWSCHAEGASEFGAVLAEMKANGAVAYVVDASELEQVDDLQQPEIFKDPERGVAGIKPITRLRLRRFVDTRSNTEIAMPEKRTYGQSIVNLKQEFLNMVRDLQEDILPRKYFEEEIDLLDFALFGGEYQDTDAKELFIRFFENNNVFHDVGNTMSAVFDGDQVDNLVEYFNEKIDNIDVATGQQLTHYERNENAVFVTYFSFILREDLFGKLEVSEEISKQSDGLTISDANIITFVGEHIKNVLAKKNTYIATLLEEVVLYQNDGKLSIEIIFDDERSVFDIADFEDFEMDTRDMLEDLEEIGGDIEPFAQNIARELAKNFDGFSYNVENKNFQKVLDGEQVFDYFIYDQDGNFNFRTNNSFESIGSSYYNLIGTTFKISGMSDAIKEKQKFEKAYLQKIDQMIEDAIKYSKQQLKIFAREDLESWRSVYEVFDEMGHDFMEKKVKIERFRYLGKGNKTPSPSGESLQQVLMSFRFKFRPEKVTDLVGEAKLKVIEYFDQNPQYIINTANDVLQNVNEYILDAARAENKAPDYLMEGKTHKEDRDSSADNLRRLVHDFIDRQGY